MSVRAAVADLREGTLDAPGELAHYLTHVLRLKPGAALVVFDPVTASEADAVLESVGDATRLSVGPLRKPAVMAPRPITFVQGLAKGDKCDAVVRDATELGATHVLVAACARSVVQLSGDRGASRVARWTRIAQEAARQCGRGDPPRVELVSWADAVRSPSSDARRFCLHVGAAHSSPLGPALAEALHDPERALAFAVGPEGGLTDDEAALAVAHGWKLASLGSLVLRTETAAAAVLGAVCIFGGELPR